jgi:hemolysin III
MKPRKQDAFSTYSHLAGAVFLVIGALVLIWQSFPHLSLIIVSTLYSLAAVFMLLASSFYHRYKKIENHTGILRKLDHISIFFMIAGSYTPLCYVYLSGSMKWGIIIAQWALVIAGLFVSIYFIKAPRVLTTMIYLLMGWMAVIPLKQLAAKMSTESLVLLILGGVAYSVGAVCYMLKKPNPKPGFFGFHEIFHVFILIGVLLHYFVVFDAIRYTI